MIQPIRIRLALWIVMFMLAFLYGCAARRPVDPAVAAEQAKSAARAAEVKRVMETLLMATEMAKVPEADRPPYAPLEGDTCQADLQALESLATQHGVTVSYYPQTSMRIMYNKPIVFGIAFYDTRTIVLTIELESCARLDVLAHELAHLFTPDRVRGEELREVVAELVALLYLRRNGYVVGVDENTANYLSAHMDGIAKITQHITLIPELVDRITTFPTTTDLPSRHMKH